MSAPAPAPFPSPPWGGTRRRAVRWEPPPQTPLPALPVTGWGRHHPESMKRWVCRSSMRNRLPPQIDYTVAAPYLRFLPTPPLPSPSCPSPCRPCCADAPRPVPDPHATLYSHHSYLLASRIDACWPTRAAAADTIRGAPPPLPCKRLSRRPARCSRQSVVSKEQTMVGWGGGSWQPSLSVQGQRPSSDSAREGRRTSGEAPTTSLGGGWDEADMDGLDRVGRGRNGKIVVRAGWKGRSGREVGVGGVVQVGRAVGRRGDETGRSTAAAESGECGAAPGMGPHGVKNAGFLEDHLILRRGSFDPFLR